MGDSGKDLRTIRSEVNLLEQEIGNLSKKKLNANSDSSKRLRIRRQLRRKREVCKQKKWWRQVLELEENVRIVDRYLAKGQQFGTRCQISSDLGYYVGCFHAYIGDKMNIPWPDLACALREERIRMSEAVRWEEVYHAELLGHLEAVGVSKQQWESSLTFEVEDDFDYCAVLCEPERVLNDQLRKDKELLNSEEARQVFLPGQKEMFTRLIEEYEAHNFLCPPFEFLCPPSEFLCPPSTL